MIVLHKKGESMKYTFEQWKKLVDAELERKCGMDSDFLPDWDYWNAWDSGMSPKSAAVQVIKNAKEN